MLKIRSPLCFIASLAMLALSQVDAQTAAPASSSAPALSKAVPTKRAKLDLRAPPLARIYPSSQLRYILAVDDSGADAATEVSVKSSRYVVRVPGAPGNQLQALPWALWHPTQAWRILTPLEAP